MYPYRRDRAAATISILAKDSEAKTFFTRHAMFPLMDLFQTTDDRWEKRDSATALLMLFTKVVQLLLAVFIAAATRNRFAELVLAAVKNNSKSDE